MSNGFWRTRPPRIVHTMNNPLELTLAIIIIVMYSFIYCVWIWSCGLIVLAGMPEFRFCCSSLYTVDAGIVVP